MRWWILPALSLCVGCATGSPSSGLEAAPQDYVQIVLINQSPTPRAKRVIVRWDGFNRLELDRIERDASMTHTLAVMGSTLSVAFVPGGSVALPVSPGERLEFILDGRGVRYRRLPSRVRAPAGN